MQNGHSSSYSIRQPGSDTTSGALGKAESERQTNALRVEKMGSEEAPKRQSHQIYDFNNILVRKAYSATITSNHIELQSALLSAEGASAFFARKMFDELLAIALNYKDKTATSHIAQAAIRESVQTSDVFRFQEILFQLCAGRPETTEGRDNLMRACTPAALRDADTTILLALLRYKIAPTWDVTDCGVFEVICSSITMGGPIPDIVRPTWQGLAWFRAVCTKDTEKSADRLDLIGWRFETLLRACEQRGGAPRQLAILWRGVGNVGQIAKMCIEKPAVLPGTAK